MDFVFNPKPLRLPRVLGRAETVSGIDISWLYKQKEGIVALLVEELVKAAGFLSACNPLLVDVKVADALDSSFIGISFPKVAAPAELAVAFLIIAFGSNFPAYGAGDASFVGVEGEPGDAGFDVAAL